MCAVVCIVCFMAGGSLGALMMAALAARRD